jgi:uncharacterized DUF497 family protein
MDVVYRFQDIEFEWDRSKAQINVKKHGITFEEATEAFFDPFYQTGDASVSDLERRDFVLGYSLSVRLLLVVHTERGERTRIISARLATRDERKIYERS